LTETSDKGTINPPSTSKSSSSTTNVITTNISPPPSAASLSEIPEVYPSSTAPKKSVSPLPSSSLQLTTKSYQSPPTIPASKSASFSGAASSSTSSSTTVIIPQSSSSSSSSYSTHYHFYESPSPSPTVYYSQPSPIQSYQYQYSTPSITTTSPSVGFTQTSEEIVNTDNDGKEEQLQAMAQGMANGRVEEFVALIIDILFLLWLLSI